uniref:Uncharacterized protein n=1 Tax=Nelumbo nucifera TaxID=4432 RepID=A0A822XUI9_NELNU|nr:TPA_asm: hypothetical protein HUJ06_024304 [Nelumbo nucifera]
MEENKGKFYSPLKRKIREVGHGASVPAEKKSKGTSEEEVVNKGKKLMSRVSEEKAMKDNKDIAGGTSTQPGKEVPEPSSMKKSEQPADQRPRVDDFDNIFSELEMLPSFNVYDLSLYNNFMNAIACVKQKE